ncbi:hypothetical protein ACW2QC_05590 [Virgibacillus sp. FSP13]
MKKRYVISALGVAGVGTAGLFLKDRANRDKAIRKVKSLAGKFKTNDETSALDDAGIPDQTGNKDLAQFENAKMVSEGSQFGVNYYNEVKAEEEA